MDGPAGAALEHVRRLAVAAGGPAVPAGLLDRARITVNFHPDRLLPDGRTVAEHLLSGGRYLSQFATGISSGGLTAYPGGDRDRWERRMFGAAYHRPGVTAGDRPIYGGLNLAGHADGASPRFGSCHLVLRAAVAARATYSHGDSVTEPAAVGTADAFGSVLTALLDEVAATGAALGVAAPTPQAWLAGLPRGDGGRGRCLDGYVEAQVHGGVDLRADVAAVVADPSLSGTPTGDVLMALADRYRAPLRHHPGFVLAPGEVPADLRGPLAPRLAAHLCDRYGADRLDAALVGRAAAAVVRNPGEWADWGDPAEALQQLKYLWHILVAQGHPDPHSQAGTVPGTRPPP